MRNLLTAFRFRDKKGLAFLAFLLSFLQLALAVGLTALTDQMANLKTRDFAFYLAALFVICGLLALTRWQMDRAKNRRMMSRKIREQEGLLRAFDRAPMLSLEAKGEGNLLEILTGDAETIARFSEVQSVDFLLGVTGCVLGLMYGSFYSWKLLVFVLVFMGLSYLIDQRFPGWNQSYWEKRQSARDRLNQRVLDILKASKLLRVQGTAEFPEKLYREAFDDYCRADIRAEKTGFRLQAFGTAKSLVFDTAFLFFSLWLILRNQIQIGTFLGFSVIMQNIIWMFYCLPGMAADFDRFRASRERVDACLAKAEAAGLEKPSETELFTAERAAEAASSPILECQQVTFTYPGGSAPVLRDFSLVMRRTPADKIYLTGPSGSGKSTFLKLLLGLYSPDKGRLILRARHPGYVPQNTPIYADTLRNNILIGRKASDEDLLALLERVNLRSVAERLGGGPDLFISQEIESNLSSGEIQKIGLARALLQADFLVMDEPFANLDPQSENELSSLLKEIDIPVLLTSHRNAFLSEAFEEVAIR